MASLFSTNYYLMFANFFPPILKCIGKENTLLLELMESSFDTTPLIIFSKQIKKIASTLILYKGPKTAAATAAAAGAMVVCICPYQNNCCMVNFSCMCSFLVVFIPFIMLISFLLPITT